MSNISQVLDLEERKFLQVLNDLNTEENYRVGEIKAKMAAQGSLFGGGTIAAIAEVRAKKIGRILNAAIDIRKGLAASFPELGTEASIDQLFTKINDIIANAFRGIDASMPPQMSPAVTSAIKDRYGHEALILQNDARNQFEILKREFALNLHRKPESAAAVTVKTGPGATLVNLGTIYGNVEQAIGTVNAGGQGELATLLRRLAEAISKADELGDERAVYLEQVQFIAQQAIEPANSRKISVVKGLLMGLRARLQELANVAQVLAVAGPAVANHFGFGWPH
jgi:hypothetical protein